MALTSRLLSYVCDEMLQVGAEWSIRTDDSCTWWPHDLAQHITTRPITDQGDDDGVLLIVETNFLVGVPPEYPETGVQLNTLNADNALSTLALGDDGVLRLRFSMRVFDDTFGWTSRWAARLCACQVADALNLAAEAAVVYPRAQRASSEHPTSGRRSDVDDAVTVRQATIDRSREIARSARSTSPRGSMPSAVRSPRSSRRSGPTPPNRGPCRNRTAAGGTATVTCGRSLT